MRKGHRQGAALAVPLPPPPPPLFVQVLLHPWFRIATLSIGVLLVAAGMRMMYRSGGSGGSGGSSVPKDKIGNIPSRASSSPAASEGHTKLRCAGAVRKELPEEGDSSCCSHPKRD